MKRYKLNTDYFREPLTLESAYWLGYSTVAAVIFTRSRGESGTDYVYTVKVRDPDLPHLEALKKALRFTGPLGSEEDGQLHTMYIHSKDLVASLYKYGLRQRKYSYGVKVPIAHLLPGKRADAYLMGAFDGKAAITMRNGRPRTRIIAPRGIPEWIQLHMARKVGESSGSIIRRPAAPSILTWEGHHQVPPILRWVYYSISGLPRSPRMVQTCRSLLEEYYGRSRLGRNDNSRSRQRVRRTRSQ